MKLVDMKVVDFCNEVDSSSPAPGGGSVSALAANIGVSLSRMMCNLSFGKKVFENLEDEDKNEFEDKFKRLGQIKDKLLNLVDKDTEAFNEVMNAFSLSKSNDQEKEIRSKAIQTATLNCIEVPLEVVQISYEALNCMNYFINKGNQNAITDLGVGILLVYAGIEGALLNVKVNLMSLKDKEKAIEIYTKCEEILEKSKESKENSLIEIHNKLVLNVVNA